MRVLSGDECRVRVYFGESDRWQGRPLHHALVERLRKEGFAGATVVRAIAGYGAKSVLHSTHQLRLSQSMPLILEVVESEDQVDKLLGIFEEMVAEGLVTVDKVRVLRYAPGNEKTQAR